MILRACWILFALTGLATAQPRLVNAKLETHSLQGPLEAEFKRLTAAQSEAGWIGYAVPVVPGDRQMCCYYSNSDMYSYRGCSLEPRSSLPEAGGVNVGPVPLEAPKNFYVMYRVENNQVTKLRTFSADCELDAGGTTVHWLTGVRPADSVSLLASYQAVQYDTVRERSPFRDNAISAIALHADPSADAILEKYLAPDQPESVRRRTAKLMGELRGKRGFEVLRRMVQEETNERIRESAVQGLAFSREAGALDIVFAAAKSDKSARIRGESLTWLARQAGRKAIPAIQSAIENDPETSVKKKGISALSQLPREEGIPLLINIAKTSQNTEVRKQAMFWLSQSRDPRAVSFFEAVLSK
jgi:HEAT repeat protein